MIFEMGFDEGVEAHREEEESMSAVQKHGNAALALQRAVDTNATCSFGLQTLLKTPPFLPGLGMVHGTGTSDLLNPKI